MKISRIYSNDESRFHNIRFNEHLNVIQADILDRKDTKKDTHNLGKSLLIELIDFLLLKQIKNKRTFFLTKGGFEGMQFFAELALNSGAFLLIRRCVDAPSKISFKRTHSSLSDFKTDVTWDEEDMPLERSQEYLNTALGFDVLPQWEYRKSATYFLRTQSDFRDVFRLDKFSQGVDRDWKPFMFDLLGFDGRLIEQKYDLETEFESLEHDLKTLEKEANVKAGEKDNIQGMLDLKREEKDRVEVRIDRFNFYEQDKELNQALVDDIDSQIHALNTQRYNCSYEVSKIKASLKMETPSVDMDKLKSLFEDVEIHFPETLEKNFESLLAFNVSITSERNSILKENLQGLRAELKDIDGELKKQEQLKEEALSQLTQRDTYFKFKESQKQLARLEGEIAILDERLAMITRTSRIEERRDQISTEIAEKVRSIDHAINQQKHASIRRIFNRIIEEVLNAKALITVTQNSLGNVDFRDFIQNPKSLQVTDESAGNTYKKLMCMAFDLAILITYAENSFYRFVYHDGALEAIEDRKKMLFINMIRKICKKYDIQYIMTLIDSDLPMDAEGKVVKFSDDEICLHLHDKDDSGKLFKRSF